MTEDSRQPRERSVPCRYCGRPTWDVDAICGRHSNRDALEVLEVALSMARHPAGKRIPPGP